MIKEAYVSPEVAKLLKEKGFNVPIWTRYDDEEDKEVIFGDKYNWNNSPMGQISAPTHQMAIKWLREVHNILLFILPGQENGKLVYLVEVWTWNEEEDIYESTYAPMPRKEPEQNIEAALKYVLENLI